MTECKVPSWSSICIGHGFESFVYCVGKVAVATRRPSRAGMRARLQCSSWTWEKRGRKAARAHLVADVNDGGNDVRGNAVHVHHLLEQ